VDTRTKATRIVRLGTPGEGGDIVFGEGMIWTTVSKIPLTVVDASDTPLCQWKGPEAIRWVLALVRSG
jgi:hypothetical protein